MKTLIRISTMKIRILFHPFTSRKSLYVWHKVEYLEKRIMYHAEKDIVILSDLCNAIKKY